MPHALYLNGEFMDLARGRISVEDRGFLFGDGIYEVIRVYGNRPFRLRAHMERLERSAAGLELTLPLRVAALEEVCLELLKRDPQEEGILYLQVTRGAGPRNHLIDPEMNPTLAVWTQSISPIPPGKRAAGVSCITVPDERWNLCHLKTTCLLINTLSKTKAVRAGAQDAIYVRPDGPSPAEGLRPAGGTVTEGTATNLFAVRGGTLHTHPADNRILHGITRAVVLDLARALGIPAREETFPKDAMMRAEEVFLTGTTTEALPVVRIDGQAVGSGRPGPITQRLQAAYTELWRGECGD